MSDTPMPAAAPSPENNVILRQMAGMRRDMHAMMEQQARNLDIIARLANRIDEAVGTIQEDSHRQRRDVTAMRSDLLLMENRIITAITEVREIAARLDEMPAREPA